MKSKSHPYRELPGFNFSSKPGRRPKKRPYIIRHNFIRRPGRKPKVRIKIMTAQGVRQHTTELPRRDALPELKRLLLNEYRRSSSLQNN